MQVEFVQWEKNGKALIIFYVNVIRCHRMSLCQREQLDYLCLTKKNFLKGIPKKVAAQLSGCYRVKVQ